MLFRKMLKNRWLVLSLLVGMTLCTAMTASMPIYTDAILKRMLIKEMDRSYTASSLHPARLYTVLNAAPLDPRVQGKAVKELDAFWESVPMNTEELEPLVYFKERTSWTFQIEPVDPHRVDPNVMRRVYLTMRSGLFDRVRLIDGRFPSPEPVDGVYEALVTDNTLVQLRTVLDHEFVVSDGQRHVSRPFRIKPVGVIAESDLQDLYWNHSSLRNYDNHFFIDESLFERDILGEDPIIRLARATWYTTYEYNDFDLDKAVTALQVFERTRDRFRHSFANYADVSFPLEETLEGYKEREAALKRFLGSLNVPLYILIAFYLYVISNLIVERQKPEIAVLRSRGAGRWQIVFIFACETLILALTAFAIGPWIGLIFSKWIGSTDTFMGFVQRTALQVRVSKESYVYAGVAACAAFLLNLIPVLLATRVSIVDQKRMAARQDKKSFWHYLGLDFIFLGLSLYGLYLFRQRIDDMIELGLKGGDLQMDPLLFAVPSLFILGLGLFLLRIYPLFVRLIYAIGKKRWPPPLYSTLLLVGRRGKHYHALMLFLLLTVATGIFNASAARTINGNLEDQIWYAQGADIVLQQRWVDDGPSTKGEYPYIPGRASAENESFSAPRPINYLEPPFGIFETLPGVEAAARVFIKEEGSVWYGNQFGRVKLMGIDTDQFGRTAWLKNGLLRPHFYDYLNLIAPDPHAVLISRTMADEWGIKPGDMLYAGWQEAGRTAFRVYGIVDYFPAFNPNLLHEEDGSKPMLIVAHLPTIQSLLRVEPYQVWLKLEEGASRQKLYDAIQENGIKLLSLQDTHTMIADSRSDPFRMAMNGMMSLGFVLSLLITFIGFMIYWVLSLQGRMLQLGIFRAMGISFAQLVSMLGVEQLLTSGAGFLIGVASGMSASFIFVPLFQIIFDPSSIMPPFEVMIGRTDTTHLALVIAIMLVLALAFLTYLLSRMKIHQAVKLGED